MSELLEQMKLLNEDHKPDGWPAVRMSEINALVSMIKSHGEQLAKANERVKKSCRWVRKSDLSLQLQTDLWFVGCVSESDIKKGMFYWKVTTCPKSISGYSENEKEAVETVEALISSCSNYEYRLINSDKQLRKEQE